MPLDMIQAYFVWNKANLMANDILSRNVLFCHVLHVHLEMYDTELQRNYNYDKM